MCEVIEAKCTRGLFRVYIDGSPHILFKVVDFRGLHSWMEPDKESRYRIALHVAGINSIVLAYSSEVRWKRVLELIDDKFLS